MVYCLKVCDCGSKHQNRGPMCRSCEYKGQYQDAIKLLNRLSDKDIDRIEARRDG